MTIHEYIKLFIILIVVTAVLYLPVFAVLMVKGLGGIRPLSYLLCFWALLIIMFATIILFNIPLSFKPERYILNIMPLQWLDEGDIKRRIVTEIRPNIMLFIPLGLFVPIAFRRMRRLTATAAVTLLLTICIEVFQYFIGRSADIDDVIANLFGGIIGYGFFKLFNCCFRSRAWWNEFKGRENTGEIL